MSTDAFPSGPASESEQLEILGEKFHMDVVTLVADDMLDPELVTHLPVEWARSHAMLPIHYRSQIGVLTSDPASISAQKHLELLLGRELVPVLASKETIASAIERCYFSRQETAQDFLRDLAQSSQAPRHGRAGEDWVPWRDQPAPAVSAVETRSDDLLQVTENAPVTQLVNLILLEAVKAGASDVHVEPFESRLRVRYRIDGMLYDQATPPKHLEPALISRLKVMARMDIAEKRLPQDGVARVRIGEREIDIRVSTIPVAEGERVVLRLLNRSVTLLPLSGLGLSEAMLATLEALLQESHGVILVCGPTGSGKTTTLYAALQCLNKDRTNILTIEDPIEYQLPDIGQIQVKPKIGLTFANGLRHILRQDPDTILVGEIRDLETAEIAIRASLTGHLVFSTLHTNDAPSAVIRLIDMGIEPYLLAASLRAVLAQRLVRRLCVACRQQMPGPDPSMAMPEALSAGGGSAYGGKLKIGRTPVWQAKGCPACLEGYRGRTGLFELMGVDAEMAEVIRTGSSNSRALRDLAVRKGMTTLLDDGLDKLSRGVTSLAEIARTIDKFA